jgi:hypothetical protein
MSTKNLARTVIEGGRDYYNSDDRRRSHGDARAAERVFIGRVLQDVDAADERVLLPRRSVGKSFHDKLGPCDRWMRSQVGRPWRKVHAELMARFDTRTLAGQHIVFDHMLPRRFREDDGAWRIRHTYFRVDVHGFLRIAERPAWRWAYKPRSYVSPSELKRAMVWAAGRKVATHGAHYYWCEPTLLLDAKRTEEQRYRQARMLDAEEAREFEAFTAECREHLAR